MGRWIRDQGKLICKIFLVVLMWSRTGSRAIAVLTMLGCWTPDGMNWVS